MRELSRGVAYAAMMAGGVAVTAASYMLRPEAASSLASLGTIVFWASFITLVLFRALRGELVSAKKYLRKPAGELVFLSYLLLHLFLYGSILAEGIALFYGKGFVIGSGLFVNYNLVPDLSLRSVFLDLFVNPSLTIQIPGVLASDLALYNFVVGFLVALLIVANFDLVSGIQSRCSRTRRWSSYVGLPVLGVLGGASCCVSVPAILAIATPTVALAVEAYHIITLTYFGLPSATVIALALNYRATAKVLLRTSTLSDPKFTPLPTYRLVRPNVQ
ncbi:MAG: hypothetical protein QW767_02270 [Thermoprotei archaeon]